MDPKLLPTQKVSAAAGAGAAAVVVVWLFGLFNIDLPSEVAAAFTSLGMFVAAYMKREG